MMQSPIKGVTAEQQPSRLQGRSREGDAESGFSTLLATFGSGAVVVLAFWLARSFWRRKRAGAGPPSPQPASVSIESFRNVVIVFRRSDHQLVAANSAAGKVFGLSAEELSTLTLDLLERRLPLGSDQISRNIALGTTPHLVTRYERPDGFQCTIEISASLTRFRGEDCVLLVGSDVSEQVRSEEHSRAELAAFRGLFDHAPWPILVAQESSRRVVAANAAARDLFDPNNLGLADLPVSRLLSGEDPAAPDRRVVAVPAASGGWRQLRVERSPLQMGGRACLQFHCRPLGANADEAGEADGSRGVAGVFDSVLEAMLIVDPTSREVVLANGAARRLYGYSSAEFSRLSTDAITTDPQGCRQICGNVVTDGDRPGELRYHRRKDGSMIAVEANFSTINYEGRVCVLCSMRQISAAAMRGWPIFTSENLAEAERGRAPGAQVEAKPFDRPLHVLVVDDEPLVREVTRRMLEARGHRTTVAEDGASGVAKVTEDPGIDVVVLDVTMPGMSGSEAMSLMLEAKPGLRIVLCSGYSSETVPFDDGNLSGARAHAFVQKPFTMETLLSAVGGGSAHSQRT
ncbi:MAG: response regulator [Phycisphaerales bacterium]